MVLEPPFKTILSIQITKNHHHFNQKLYEYLMKKIKIYQKNYFLNVMVIQSSVLKVVLMQDIPFVYPNHE
jgi:hypothetical protein